MFVNRDAIYTDRVREALWLEYTADVDTTLTQSRSGRGGVVVSGFQKQLSEPLR